jgi:flagellar motor switch protein FliG
MSNIDPHLRKAAVLLRSLDSDTATLMLSQLSAEEAAALRAAMRAVGSVENDEQAEVMAELRSDRVAKRVAKNAAHPAAVELELSSSFASNAYREESVTGGAASNAAVSAKRFEFLENAPVSALVAHLAREHAQTIAVVLAHLAPERAAAVLAALPPKVQSETVERLSILGDTDPEYVGVVERELAAWAAKRDGTRGADGRRRDTMAAILAAADAKSRNQILSSMKDHKAAVTSQFAAPRREPRTIIQTRVSRSQIKRPVERKAPEPVVPAAPRATAPPVPELQLPRIGFDDLTRLDARMLSAVLRQVDADLLALALAGSHEELVDRICDQMPKQTAREFRRQLRRLGPTRLSDVEAAQRAVAVVAARLLAERRQARSGANVSST